MLSLAQLFARFPDDSTAEGWFRDGRWPSGIACPVCGSLDVLSGAQHKTMPYRCRDCDKRFSVRTGTAMEGSKLGFQTWAIAISLFANHPKGISSVQLGRDLGISQKSAWHLAHRLRRAWDDHGGDYGGPIEIDETYVGGKEANKHRKKRLRSGRGTVGKVPVAGAKDRATGRVSATVLPNVTGPTLRAFVEEHRGPRASVFTDELRAYRGLTRHSAVNHGGGQYVNGTVHTNGIESFWAVLKRTYATHHHWSRKHMQRYVDEVAGRFNQRDLDALDRMRAVWRGMLGKRLPWDDLTAEIG